MAGVRGAAEEAISFDSREYDISVIENREGEFVVIRQIEEGDTEGGIIIPKDKFKGSWSFKRGV